LRLIGESIDAIAKYDNMLMEEVVNKDILMT